MPRFPCSSHRKKGGPEAEGQKCGTARVTAGCRPKEACVLAVGGELKNTFCIASGDLFYLSPYVGDLEDSAPCGLEGDHRPHGNTPGKLPPRHSSVTFIPNTTRPWSPRRSQKGEERSPHSHSAPLCTCPVLYGRKRLQRRGHRSLF